MHSQMWSMAIWKSDSQYYVVFCICCNLKGLLVTGIGTDRWIFVLLWIDHLINIGQIKFYFMADHIWTIWVQLFVMLSIWEFDTVDTCYLVFA